MGYKKFIELLYSMVVKSNIDLETIFLPKYKSCELKKKIDKTDEGRLTADLFLCKDS